MFACSVTMMNPMCADAELLFDVRRPRPSTSNALIKSRHSLAGRVGSAYRFLPMRTYAYQRWRIVALPMSRYCHAWKPGCRVHLCGQISR